ncbi:MAG: molybdate ABC transporter substrate-binding protein [Sandaracinus sp.]
MRRLATISLVLALLACGESPSEGPITLDVAAASSLTEVVPRLARELGAPLTPHFDASSALARGIELGGGADVFLSADEAWADHVVAAGLADPEDRVAFATNHLVVVVPRGDTSIHTLADLSRVEHVAVAAAEVPAGRLARAALERAGILATIAPRLVEGPNVRAALAWVTRGEAEAALVYATDARVEPSVSVAFEISSELAPPAVDVALALHGPHHEAARAFVLGLRSPGAQRVLGEAGFGAPP